MLRLFQIAVAVFVISLILPYFMNFIHTMNTVSTVLN